MKQVFPLQPISRGTFALLLGAAGTLLIPVVALWRVPGAQGGWVIAEQLYFWASLVCLSGSQSHSGDRL